jgi:type I restriction enzyme, S subunit
MSSLPAGWRSVPLKDLGTWLSGGTPSTDEPRYWDGDLPWISAASMKEFEINDSDRRITELGALSGTRVVPEGTVLFVVRGMSLKSEFRVGITKRQVAFGQDCKAILPAPDINGKFLALALKARTQQILGMVDEAGHGTGRLPTDLISKLTIGVPPLHEQLRITKILDSMDEQISMEQRALRKHEIIATALGDSLIPVTPDPQRLGPGWDLVQLVRVVPTVEYGISTPLGSGSGIPVLRMNNLLSGKVRLEDLKVATETVPLNLILKDRDVLFNRTNSFEHVGRTSIWRCELDKATFASYLVRLNPDRTRITPEYLVRWLNQRAIQQRIRTVATPAVQQVNINPTALRRICIELPCDFSRQQQITKILDQVDNTINAIKESLEKMRLLRQGLMGDLLSGRVQAPKTLISTPQL